MMTILVPFISLCVLIVVIYFGLAISLVNYMICMSLYDEEDDLNSTNRYRRK